MGPAGGTGGRVKEDSSRELRQLVAEALDHARQGGVLHRDIRPSNVDVTPAGRA